MMVIHRMMKNIKHNLTANRKSKVETSMYGPDEAEEMDDNETL